MTKALKTAYIIFFLIALALLVRLTIVYNTYIISSDGPFYLEVARHVSDGDFETALQKQVFHPLYPFLVGIASWLVHNLEWAGYLVSILFAAMGIIPLFFIGRKYFPEPIVIVSCLLYAVHPGCSRLSSSILTTGLFIGVFLYALWVTIIAFQSRKFWYFLLSGLLSFIMYLIRPDGLVFFFVSVIVIIAKENKLVSTIGVLINVARSIAKGNKLASIIGVLINLAKSIVKENRFLKSLVYVFLLAIPWIFLLPPYIYLTTQITGYSRVTGKVSFSKMIGTETKEIKQSDLSDNQSASTEVATDNPSAKQYFNGLYLLIVNFIRGAHPILFILFVLGLFRHAKQKDRDAPFFIWLVFGVFMVLFYRYGVLYGRLSVRYTVPLFVMVIFWAGEGLFFLSELIYSKVNEKLMLPWRKDVLLCLTMAIIMTPVLFYTFRPVGKIYLIEKATGQALGIYHMSKSIPYKKPLIITISRRLAYYADGALILPTDLGGDYQKVAQAIMKEGIDYAVLDHRLLKKFPEIERELVKFENYGLRVELISTQFNNYSPESHDFHLTYKFTKK